MAKKAKNASASIDPNLTLAQLSERYLQQMEKDGKSSGTTFSYSMELKTAQAELGADTPVASITPDQIDKFNGSQRVNKLKNGKPKAQPSILKTRRVIRLALSWAAQSGLIASAPYAVTVDAETLATSTPKARARTRKTPERDEHAHVTGVDAVVETTAPAA